VVAKAKADKPAPAPVKDDGSRHCREAENRMRVAQVQEPAGCPTVSVPAALWAEISAVARPKPETPDDLKLISGVAELSKAQRG